MYSSFFTQTWFLLSFSKILSYIISSRRESVKRSPKARRVISSNYIILLSPREIECWILSICERPEIEYPDASLKASQRGSTSSWNKHALCRSSHQIQLRLPPEVVWRIHNVLANPGLKCLCVARASRRWMWLPEAQSWP